MASKDEESYRYILKKRRLFALTGVSIFFQTVINVVPIVNQQRKYPFHRLS